MGPVDVNDSEFQNTIDKWLSKQNELIVLCYRPHLGIEGDYYAIHSSAAINSIVATAANNSVIYVSRSNKFPVRGIVEDGLIETALATVPDNEWWLIAKPSVYPSSLSFLGSGNTHTELIELLDSLRDSTVWIGPDFDFPDAYLRRNDDPSLIIGHKGSP